jgi:hypothetical protein
VTLVRDMSKILVDLGMPLISVIPQDLCTAGDKLEALDIILECLQDAYASGHDHVILFHFLDVIYF